MQLTACLAPSPASSHDIDSQATSHASTDSLPQAAALNSETKLTFPAAPSLPPCVFPPALCCRRLIIAAAAAVVFVLVFASRPLHALLRLLLAALCCARATHHGPP
ncbi:hypothetical protein CDD81_7924 [Ophiocordyceps australis]|uniref:Uncharacterized protein n=1 Tax=Ophiocordyceps australis TaxID=1399860 RepID=A0A2C5Y4L8_9HYPO|nr:hypothetical protein CDD81_7924 [Ophiocordyceps australis]